MPLPCALFEGPKLESADYNMTGAVGSEYCAHSPLANFLIPRDVVWMMRNLNNRAEG
jgi:hypothetical protein